jgi:chemotaxis protein histidine kinase CheA
MTSLRAKLLLVSAGVVAAAGAAGAAGLGDYGELFPANPCQDGWAACMVDGEAVDPTVRYDGGGRPIPADYRLDWFQLEPTTSFTPFVALADYPQDQALPPKAGALASADAAVAEEIARLEEQRKANQAARDEQKKANEEARKAEDERLKAAAASAEKAREEAARLAREQEAARKKAEEDAARRKAEEEKALAEARARDAAEADRLAAEQEARRKAEEEARRKAEEEARRKAEEAARKAEEEQQRLAAEQEAARKAEEERKRAEEEAARKAKEEEERLAREEEDARRKAEEDAARKAEEERKAQEAAERAEKQAEEDQNCNDLTVLETPAVMGRLREGQVSCLEGAYASAASQTDKDKISRVLIVNAEGKGDRAEWERLVSRHLQEVDRSDPDLCFSYALYLSKGGAARAWGTIEWADVALENKSRWQGSTYKSRVYNLLQLKAEAAAALWEASAQAVVAGEGDRAELQENEKKLRGLAKNYAREWLDYARVSGQEDRKAMALCVSAAGSKKFCEGG